MSELLIVSGDNHAAGPSPSGEAQITYDLIIRNGAVVDGTGAAAVVADVAIAGGRIAAIGPALAGEARQTIDARGMIVTPGFVDIHTHYDGQATWDPLLEPSTLHGVTTLMMGNCGVGFAPVRPGAEPWLIQLMEGVEDIPGSALAEGLTWGWETFPQYLDILESMPRAVDIAAQAPHGPIRAYVMGERGVDNEPATPEDIAAMKSIVREALDAGAFGFSTSRTITHKGMDRKPVPGTFATEEELFGIGEALRDAGHGIYEIAATGAAGEDIVAPPAEVEWMRRLSAAIERPVSFALLQVDAAPEQWRELLDASVQAAESGAQIRPQIAGRPTGILVSLEANHPFDGRPSYVEIADLPLTERVAAMRDPMRKARILSEEIGRGYTTAKRINLARERIYFLGDPPDYEPGPERLVKTIAEREGVDLDSKIYDLLLEDDGKALLMFPILNYSYGDSEATYEMLRQPLAALGLGDGGAHCGAICDASTPTWMLTHWVRDRVRGPRLPLEQVVRKLSHDTAELYGMADRGVIAVGLKADLNVIDLDHLALHAPSMIHDLPAGGRRFNQGASGYMATIVSGEVVRRNGVDTGARPGRLVRAGR
jgi:N-acyl-D-amino-acid deacylase